jgi:hypothetical protein
VQDQQRYTWPAKLVVARAYLDQRSRSNAIPANEISELQSQIEKADKAHLKGKQADKLKELGAKLEGQASSVSDQNDAKRATALAAILKNPVQ